MEGRIYLSLWKTGAEPLLVYSAVGYSAVLIFNIIITDIVIS
jgi:hypothetical protein